MQRRAIGFDLVAVKRCARMLNYSDQQLLRMVSYEELVYIRAGGVRNAPQRLAVRFAAREALCKALHSMYPGRSFSLLTVCRAARVVQEACGVPRLMVAWELLAVSVAEREGLSVLLSLTHHEGIAGAMVLLELVSGASPGVCCQDVKL